MIWLNLGQPQ